MLRTRPLPGAGAVPVFGGHPAAQGRHRACPRFGTREQLTGTRRPLRGKGWRHPCLAAGTEPDGRAPRLAGRLCWAGSPEQLFSWREVVEAVMDRGLTIIFDTWKYRGASSHAASTGCSYPCPASQAGAAAAPGGRGHGGGKEGPPSPPLCSWYLKRRFGVRTALPLNKSRGSSPTAKLQSFFEEKTHQPILYFYKILPS